MKGKKGLGLTGKILIGLVLGVICGVIINVSGLAENKVINKYIIDGILAIVGGGFISAIKMMMVPVVFFSLVVGAASIGEVSRLGRIGIKTLSFYMVTTALAIAISLGVGLLISPGLGGGIDLSDKATLETVSEAKTIVETVVSIIPTNPVSALANGEMLQIIFFAIFVGISITILGDKVSTVKTFMEQTNDIMLNIMLIIMKFAPYGVFALITRTFATEGFEAIMPLGKYFFAVLLALAIQMIVTYPSLLYAFTRLNPIQFFKNALPAITFAFSSSSSSATIPVTLECMDKNQGVESGISSFTIPLGATINMDGSAMMQGVAVILIAQLSGIEITLSMFMTVIAMAVLASIGTAGVPGAGLIMLSIVLTQVGLSPEFIPIIMGVDRLLDMTRTAVNITGDQACTVIIANNEKALNKDIFYQKNHSFE
ncbi:MAG: dicarboxylate/amino acid:cation symporter [Bacilli bacterium]